MDRGVADEPSHHSDGRGHAARSHRIADAHSWRRRSWGSKRRQDRTQRTCPSFSITRPGCSPAAHAPSHLTVAHRPCAHFSLHLLRRKHAGSSLCRHNGNQPFEIGPVFSSIVACLGLQFGRGQSQLGLAASAHFPRVAQSHRSATLVCRIHRVGGPSCRRTCRSHNRYSSAHCCCRRSPLARGRAHHAAARARGGR